MWIRNKPLCSGAMKIIAVSLTTGFPLGLATIVDSLLIPNSFKISVSGNNSWSRNFSNQITRILISEEVECVFSFDKCRRSMPVSAVLRLRLRPRLSGKASSRLDELLVVLGRFVMLCGRFIANAFLFVPGVIVRDFLRFVATRGNSEGVIKAISVQVSA